MRRNGPPSFLPVLIVIAVLVGTGLYIFDLVPSPEEFNVSIPGPSNGGQGGDQPQSLFPPRATTAPLAQPDGVAVTYLNAWREGDYEGMYSLLSQNSQLSYTQRQFEETYTNAMEVMTAYDMEIVENSLLYNDGSTGAQFDFTVTYNTTVLGDIAKDISMRLVFENERWAVVWDPGMVLPELVGGNTLALNVTTPERANIYDRDGEWLVAANSEVVTLRITTGQLDDEFEDDMLALLSEMLRVSPERIRQQYQGFPDGRLIALGDVDLEIYNQYRLEYQSYPNLSVSTDKTGRRYYNNGLAAHVLGYTGFVPQERCEEYQERGYACDEIVGLAGLEEWGEEYLAGLRGGSLSAFTPSGSFYGEVASRQPEPAQSLYLTLDREMQAIVEEALADAYEFSQDTWAPIASGAAVVVLDVNTGEVVAMASYPTFDPNVFHPFNAHPYADGNYISDIVNSPLTPLLNRATQGQQPAGSVFKIVSASAALAYPEFGENWTYNSTGSWSVTIGGSTVTRTDWLEGGHGTVNIPQALTVSCNSCFYQVGFVTAQEDFDYLPEYAEMYHFGQTFGLPIAEESGRIPSPDEVTSDGRPWSVLDSVNMAIGQGDVLVTPLQIAVMTAAVANGGTIYQPQLVDRIGLIGEEPSVVIEPEVISTLDVPEEHLQLIQEGMRQAVIGLNGTAEYRLGSLQVPAAGKTGTAQTSGTNPPIAWFTGYVPYDEPEFAIAVMVENGGQGSSVAAPIFRRIVERWYDTRVLDYPRDWQDPELFDFVAPGE